MELLLHRYNNIEYIMNMEIDEGLDFIKKAFDKDFEEKLWQQYLVDRAKMDSKDNFKSFEEYKKKATSKVKSKNENNEKSDIKSILEKADKIKKMDEAYRKGVEKN